MLCFAVMGPGIALLVCGILGIVVGVGNVAAVASGMGGDPQRKNDPGYRFGQYCGASVSAIWGLIVTLGGFCLMKLRSHGMAKAGAVFALLPCNPCCLLGLPSGIWALVVMNDPGAYIAFE